MFDDESLIKLQQSFDELKKRFNELVEFIDNIIKEALAKTNIDFNSDDYKFLLEFFRLYAITLIFNIYFDSKYGGS